LLDIPGYDVAALVEKSGKSASHIYARLSLLQLIPTVAEAFTQERITASHANLLARLPQEAQATAYEQCWRKDWQDKEPHLLPAKHLTAWIQANLYLSLADAPFNREDPNLNPAAGACTTCPRRSGYNTTLFCDVQGDQCLDGFCYQSKVEAFLDREIAAHLGLIQIENGWRNPKEQRPGAVQRGHVREIEAVTENADAEPVMPCEAAKAAIVVYGKQLGRKLTVCTDKHCPVHDPQAASEAAANPAPTIAPASEIETEQEAAERQVTFEQRRAEHEEEQRRREEDHKQQLERKQREYEAEQSRREELRKSREAAFERIVANAPAAFSPAQLRVLLRAIVNLDPYTFADDLADDLAGENENEQRTAEEVLLSTIDNLTDSRLTGFTIRLALAGHRGIPREGEFDFLGEAEGVFTPSPPAEEQRPKKAKKPTPIKARTERVQRTSVRNPKLSKKNIAA
jgi:ParB family chromosome partitioning protein